MPARVDQDANPGHSCSTEFEDINEGFEIDHKSTYVSRHFRIALLFINSLGVLRCCLNRTGHLSGYSLIGTKRFGTNRGIDGLKVVEKSLRDSLFRCHRRKLITRK